VRTGAINITPPDLLRGYVTNKINALCIYFIAKISRNIKVVSGLPDFVDFSKI